MSTLIYQKYLNKFILRNWEIKISLMNGSVYLQKVFCYSDIKQKEYYFNKIKYRRIKYATKYKRKPLSLHIKKLSSLV